jgi:hypothetical protein
VGLADQVGGRRPEGAGHQADRVAEGDIEQVAGGLRGDAERPGAGGEVPGKFGHAVAGQEVVKEGLVTGREAVAGR